MRKIFFVEKIFVIETKEKSLQLSLMNEIKL